MDKRTIFDLRSQGAFIQVGFAHWHPKLSYAMGALSFVLYIYIL